MIRRSKTKLATMFACLLASFTFTTAVFAQSEAAGDAVELDWAPAIPPPAESERRLPSEPTAPPTIGAPVRNPVAAESVEDSPVVDRDMSAESVPAEDAGGDDTDAVGEVVELTVEVEQLTGAMEVEPLGNAEVQVSVIEPPHRVIGAFEETADSNGVARFSLPVAENQQAFASAMIDGRRVYSDTGISLDQPGESTLRVRNSRDSSDLSTVFAPRVITIAELWEDYIVFTQVWSLATTSPARVIPQGTNRTSGLRIPLPADASGIRVVQPEEGVQSVEHDLFYQLPIEPAGTGQNGGISFVVRFSIKHGNRSELSWEQELPFAVENFALVVPQQSQHERFAALDVAIDVPLCAESPSPNLMCFDTIRNRAEGVPMLEGVAVRVAGNGITQSLPSTLRVTTTGWPSPPRVSLVAGLVAAGIALLALLGLLITELRRRRSDAPELTEVQALRLRQDELLEETLTLRARLNNAELLEAEYEVELARIQEELAMVLSRIRSLSPLAHERGHAGG